MKKLVASIVFAFFLCSAAFGANISFKVGDDTLTVNGQPMTVKKPYVANGATLVPLRVIVEAFGASVKWNDADQSVELDLDDTHIVITIGSDTAIVNGTPEKLLAAPVLDVDTTMVPLRFIAEKFGAAVAYDEATGQITVTKDDQSVYKNTTANYTLTLTDGWQVNDRVPSMAKFTKDTSSFNISVFKNSQNPASDEAALENAVKDHYYQEQRLVPSAVKSSMLAGNKLCPLISYYYTGDGAAMNDVFIAVPNGAYIIIISAHFVGTLADKHKPELFQMLASATFGAIPANQQNIHPYGYKQTIPIDKIAANVQLPLDWEYTLSEQSFSAGKDMHHFAFLFEDVGYCIDRKVVPEDDYELLNYYKNIFKKYDGEKPAYEKVVYTNSITSKYATSGPNVYYYDEYGQFLGHDIPREQLPPAIPDFYRNQAVYAFYTEEKEDQDSRLVFVFKKKNSLIAATCKIDSAHTKGFYLQLYGDIVKSILESE